MELGDLDSEGDACDFSIIGVTSSADMDLVWRSPFRLDRMMLASSDLVLRSSSFRSDRTSLRF
ncbi:hypothetical protein L484_008485 [Morus notabilis]|uniref:Uncharacterized protein n=1 Tax=Morus notabilis TaxID=981085 RepID=W9SHJ1_9ROSA|nr:hypothetical protein L484_008485 [Morus notabilis]